MQQTTRREYRRDLQAWFIPLRLLVRLLHYRFGIRLVNRVFSLKKGTRARGLVCEERVIAGSSEGSHKIRLRIYRPAGETKALPALLYIHGGGYALGIPEQSHRLYAELIARRPVIIIAPDYRLSVKDPYPAGFNDCYDTLLWMKENQIGLGISSDRFIVAGHSAGGGMAAALALKARDTGEIKIAFQMPVYPMLDYRQNTDSCKRSLRTPLWDSVANRLAWKLYLKGLSDQEMTVPVYASPALNEDFSDLPPAISFVGSLEPFADETIGYMDSLKNAGVEVRFRVFDGVFHAAEEYSGNSAYSAEAKGFQLHSFAEYYDRYLTKLEP